MGALPISFLQCRVIQTSTFLLILLVLEGFVLCSVLGHNRKRCTRLHFAEMALGRAGRAVLSTPSSGDTWLMFSWYFTHPATFTCHVQCAHAQVMPRCASSSHVWCSVLPPAQSPWVQIFSTSHTQLTSELLQLGLCIIPALCGALNEWRACGRVPSVHTEAGLILFFLPEAPTDTYLSHHPGLSCYSQHCQCAGITCSRYSQGVKLSQISLYLCNAPHTALHLSHKVLPRGMEQQNSPWVPWAGAAPGPVCPSTALIRDAGHWESVKRITQLWHCREILFRKRIYS